MKATDICRVLTELHIKHYPDSLNPDFTIHIAEGEKHNGTLIENNWFNDEPRLWELRSLACFDLSPTWEIATEEDLRVWVKREFNKE